jgi:biotin transport system substrate-specific component
MASRVRTMTNPLAALAVDVVTVLLFANLTAIAGRIAVNLPFSPVPITGQTLMVLLAGAALGSRRGAASQVAYLLEGVIGLPVFAGGTSGIGVLLGPTGGYLIGFVACAGFVGWLVERGLCRNAVTGVLTMLAGSVLVYVFGAAWLGHFVSGGIQSVLVQGVLPFLPGDVLKSLIAAGVVPSARWTLSRWTGIAGQ